LSSKTASHSIFSIDYSTVTFTKDWDVDIISQQEATKNEMAVLSTYLSDVVGNIDKNGKSLINTRPIMCNTDYESGQDNKYLRHGSQPEDVPTIHGTPQLQPYWAAGYSFSRGHFVVNVPYDFHQPMIFQGEEMSIGIRGFTIGYDFYVSSSFVFLRIDCTLLTSCLNFVKSFHSPCRLRNEVYASITTLKARIKRRETRFRTIGNILTSMQVPGSKLCTVYWGSCT